MHPYQVRLVYPARAHFEAGDTEFCCAPSRRKYSGEMREMALLCGFPGRRSEGNPLALGKAAAPLVSTIEHFCNSASALRTAGRATYQSVRGGRARSHLRLRIHATAATGRAIPRPHPHKARPSPRESQRAVTNSKESRCDTSAQVILHVAFHPAKSRGDKGHRRNRPQTAANRGQVTLQIGDQQCGDQQKLRPLQSHFGRPESRLA